MTALNSDTPFRNSPKEFAGVCISSTGAITGHTPSEGCLHYPDVDLHWISSGSKARSEILSFYVIL